MYERRYTLTMDYISFIYRSFSLVYSTNVGSRIMKMLQLLERFMTLFLIFFGLYLFYQLLRKIFGGSWGAEALIIGLLLFVINFLFRLATTMTQVTTDVHHLQRQFDGLSADFKDLKTDFKDLKTEFNDLGTEFKELRTEFKELKDYVYKKSVI